MTEGVVKQRYYELDWLRVMAVFLVLLYHVGMIFVRWDWHIKSAEKSLVLEQIMEFCHQWRMPLLLLVSGAGSYFAMGRLSGSSYLGERARRLLIPFFACIPIVVAPQVYIERLDKYPNFFVFLRHFFDGIYPEGGNFSWHHLWFILYLFVYTLVLLPLFLFLRKGGATRLNQHLLAFARRRGGLLYLVLPILISQFILRPIWPEENHSLVYDWAYFVFYGCFFLFGYVFASDRRYFDLLLEQRRVFLVAGLLSVVAFYTEWWLIWPYRAALWLKFDDLFGMTKICMSWFWVLTLMGYARRYLTKSHPWLARLNESVYPFYIWHQVVIVVLGYSMVQWPLGLWTRFGLITLASLVVTLVLCETVRRIEPLRFIFGLKPAKPEPVSLQAPRIPLNAVET